MKKLFLLPLAMFLLAGCGCADQEPESHGTGLNPETTGESTGPASELSLGLISASSREAWGQGVFTKIEGEKSTDPAGNVQFAVMNQSFGVGSFFAIHRFDTEDVDPTNHSCYTIENEESAYADYIRPLVDNAAYAVTGDFIADFYIKASQEESGRKVYINFHVAA